MQPIATPGYTVFISYSWDSREHLEWVAKLADALDAFDDLHVIFDQYDLWAGRDVTKFMERGLASDRVIMVLTPTYAAKATQRAEGGVGYESMLITATLFKDAPEDRFIPILRGSAAESVPAFLSSKVYVDMRQDDSFASRFEEVVRGIRRQPARLRGGRGASRNPSGGQLTSQPGSLINRLTEAGHWGNLLKAASRAATAGGIAGMHLYRKPFAWPEGDTDIDPAKKNPTVLADLEATAAALQTLDAQLSRISRKNDYVVKYLGEDTWDTAWLEENLSERIVDRVKDPKSFFTERSDELRIILDGIDGTGSFVRGVPLFCSAVAILVGSQPRVAAIYDPIHHMAYSAMLSGPPEDPAATVEAWAHPLASGERIDLTHVQGPAKPRDLSREAVGVHFSRSQPDTLKLLLKAEGNEEFSMLERLSRGSGALYALNSGVLAMTEVARGAFGAFINVSTNQWDIAAGEVLVRACGGEVTDIHGRPVDYSRFSKVSVAAARAGLHSSLMALIGEKPK